LSYNSSVVFTQGLRDKFSKLQTPQADCCTAECRTSCLLLIDSRLSSTR